MTLPKGKAGPCTGTAIKTLSGRANFAILRTAGTSWGRCPKPAVRYSDMA